MVNELHFEVNFDAVADVLGVARETLPSNDAQRSEIPPSAVEKLVSGFALTDHEWEIIRPHFPRGVVARSLNDRGFLDGILWRERAKDSGKSWWFVPKSCGNPVATMRGRFARWCEWGWWQALNIALEAEAGLSDRRKQDFARIADEAEQRRARLLAGRK